MSCLWRAKHVVGTAGTLACVLSAGIVACSSPSTPNSAHSEPSRKANSHDQLETLRSLAQRQLTHPDEAAKSAPAPPAMDAEAVRAIPKDSPDFAKAMLPLDAVRSQLATPPALAAAPAEEEPAEEAVVESIKLYTQAREKLADGRASQAIADLERAARLNPSSPQIQRLLGDAHAAAGRRSAAVNAYTRAIRLGLRDPALEAALGREAARARRFDDAAPLLNTAMMRSRESGDSIGAAVAGVDFADCLAGMGYLSAARDVLRDALLSLPAAPPAASLRPEVAEVFRRRAELWQKAGDLSLRLDDAQSALAAYDKAGEFPTVDPVALVPRRIYACQRCGQSARAALVLLDEIDRVQGRIEDRHLAVLATLAKNPAIGPALSEAISDRAANPAYGASPSIQGRLARASAACVAPVQARRILEQRLTLAPAESDTFAALLAAYGDDARARAAAVARLTGIAPDLADSYAEWMIRRGSGIDAAMHALSERRDEPDVLLRAAMLRRLGKPVEALTLLEATRFQGPLRPAASSLIAACAASSGQWPKALAAAQEPLNEPEPARCRADALASVQRYADALAALGIDHGPAASSVQRAVPDLLDAAELAIKSDQPRQAEKFLLRALELDKYDERPYDALIDLYAPRTPLADEAKLTALAKSLRDNIPSSKVARGIAARELLTRGLWEQAESQLRSMVDSDSESITTLTLLAAAWENQARTNPSVAERAQQWVRERMKGREDSPTLVMLLARMMAAAGKADEAEGMLSERYQRWPSPEIAKMREFIVRDSLADPVRAANLARERLATGPRDIDQSIELAAVQVEAGDFSAAERALEGGLPPEIPLSGGQTGKLIALLAVLKPEAVAKAEPVQAEAALRLFDKAASRVGDLPPPLQLSRLLLECSVHASQPERVLAAVQAQAGKIQLNEAQLAARVADVLFTRTSPTDGLRFLGAAVNKFEPFNVALADAWFRLTIVRGEPSDIRDLVRSINKPGEMCKVVNPLFNRPNSDVPRTEKAQRTELAYLLGNGASSIEREALAEAGYRTALEIMPDHAWTLNNLGYMLLERGDAPDEAERMIVDAYKTLNTEASVIDSLGWMRYKRGQFDDSGEGENRIDGAVTLLKAAIAAGVASPDESPNAEQLDHLGDALWRSGEHDEARRRWREAEANLRRVLALRDPTGESPARKRETMQLTSVMAKLNAAAENREPAIARTQAEYEAAKPKNP